MSKKKQTVTLEELKVGDDVEIVIKTKILQIDEDESIRVEGKEHAKWMWPNEHKSIKFRVPERPLIPEDASAVSYMSAADYLIFAQKGDDGSWTDSDGDEYADTAELIAAFNEFGKPDSIRVYDKRGA